MSWSRRVLSSCCLVSVIAVARPVNDVNRAPRTADISLESDAQVIEATVPERSTLSGMLLAHDLGEGVVQQIVEATKTVFDPRRLKARNPYRLEMGVDGILQAFRYEIDTDKFLRIVGLGSGAGQRFEAEIVPYPKERALVAIRGEISSDATSLVAAVDDAGENITLALAMADLFSGDVDFNSELQPADSFHVLVEKELREGEMVGYGPILAAEFVNEGRHVQAFRYEVPGGKPGYYDAAGRSIRRFFLKSPLKFDARVTSGFSRRRMHPVLGDYRAHLAVDYGAPVGAPVVAVAPGVVVSAGYSSSSGNMVHLRHNGGYETFYLHLSGFASGVRAGTHVGQGELIGKVGATGLATGPHLDFRVKRGGDFINPMTVYSDMPPGDPIPSEYLAAFQLSRQSALSKLE
jgi:murein DD-endopeptidase MepM/ murein hydrolase activator NlpD